MENRWIQYWENQTLFSDALIKKNTDVFLKHIGDIFSWDSHDVVLDIGSGSGYLASQIHSLVKQVYCVDTSSRAIRRGRQLCGSQSSVAFRLLSPTAYTNLSFLPKAAFSKVLCVSVIQYFDTFHSLQLLLRSVLPLLKRDGVFLIADIIPPHSFLKDTWAFLDSSIRHGVFMNSLRFLIKSRFSIYYSVRKKQGLLTIEQSRFQQLCNEEGMGCHFYSLPLSLNTNRYQALINRNFPPR